MEVGDLTHLPSHVLEEKNPLRSLHARWVEGGGDEQACPGAESLLGDLPWGPSVMVPMSSPKPKPSATMPSGLILASHSGAVELSWPLCDSVSLA